MGNCLNKEGSVVEEEEVNKKDKTFRKRPPPPINVNFDCDSDCTQGKPKCTIM